MLGRRSFLGACIGAVAASKVPPVQESSLSFDISAEAIDPETLAASIDKEIQEAADLFFSIMTVPARCIYVDRDYNNKIIKQTGDIVTVTFPFRFVKQEQK